MYVEISPRQSGKTTRLINEVICFLKENKDKTALIVAPKECIRKNIIYKIQEKCGDLCSKRTITSYKMFPSPTSMKQFVDNIDGMSDENLVVDYDAYYTGIGCHVSNEKCVEIYKTYKEIPKVTPIKFIKRHKL
jgi:hypothetical protein